MRYRRKTLMLRNRNPKTVVITGASSGIGRATAHEFARQGARIGLIARGRPGLDAAKREVEQLGGQAIVLPADVAHPDEVELAAETVENNFGPIDVWINNAAITVFAPIERMIAHEFERVTEVSYLGVVHGTLSALKRMQPRDRGHIIQIGSALSYRAIPLHAAYCAAQHAIKAFCDSLRVELRDAGSRVRLTLVLPSGVNTPLWNHLHTKMDRLTRPMDRVYQPEVIARAIAWASEHNRREIFVGFPAMKAVYGNMFGHWLADWDLSRTGYDRQMVDRPIDLDHPDNIDQPLPHDPGIHGPHDDLAHRFSPQLWLMMHRPLLIGLALGSAATRALTRLQT
jgi:NAD(P)-dependent dehydrogenase (short-subunit alcohol dehydrogenase family)